MDSDFYEKDESEFEEGDERQQIEEDLFNHIVWAPRIWRPFGAFLFDCIERPNELGFPIGPGHFGASGSFMMKRMSSKENRSEFLQNEPAYTRHEIYLPKNKAFSNKPIHLGPCRSTLFPIQSQPFVSVFSHRELFADEEMSKGLLTPL
ncbi:hypothetical protein Lser_V15G34682 [Lactuca serriola]